MTRPSANASTGDAAILLTGVTKSYGRTVAVRDLTLEIPRGELFAFLGPNGAGKTTTIKMIVGLLRPDEGEVHVCGHEIGANGLFGPKRVRQQTLAPSHRRCLIPALYL